MFSLARFLWACQKGAMIGRAGVVKRVVDLRRKNGVLPPSTVPLSAPDRISFCMVLRSRNPSTFRAVFIALSASAFFASNHLAVRFAPFNTAPDPLVGRLVVRLVACIDMRHITPFQGFDFLFQAP